MSTMQAGPPPGLMAAFQGGGQAQPEQAEPQQGSGEREPIAALRRMIADAQIYLGSEPDAVDKAGMAKLLAQLHQFLAQDQKDAEAALGGGPATRLMRKLGQ